tara:strand:+ start:3002 stop:3934 length:933 start_codon:yes stop_codon:yes gene_type:complete
MSIKERVDNITKISTKYAVTNPPAPESVKIELTGYCNFKCNFCAHVQRLRTLDEMDQKFFERIVKEMREAGVQELGMFYLGESFLCSWLPEAIRYAKEDCGYPYTFLTTNGSLSTPTKVKACMEAGLDSLKFSFNYSDEEQFKEITKVRGVFFHKMIENIKAAHAVREEGGYDCGLYASYIEYDGDQGERMKEALEDILPYVDDAYALPLYNQAALVENDEWSFVQGNRGRLEAMRDPLPCWSIFTEGHISFDGKLSACCFDHDARFDMGNLNELSFMDAWNSQKFQDLRQAHLAKCVDGTICEQCVAYT